MKTSPTLYVSKVLIRHDRTPNVTGRNRIRFATTPKINNKNTKRCTDITYKNFPQFSFSSTAGLCILTNHALPYSKQTWLNTLGVGSISLWNQSERSFSLIVTTILLWIFDERTPVVMVNNKIEVTHLRTQYMKYSSSKSDWIQNHPQNQKNNEILGSRDLVCVSVCGEGWGTDRLLGVLLDLD